MCWGGSVHFPRETSLLTHLSERLQSCSWAHASHVFLFSCEFPVGERLCDPPVLQRDAWAFPHLLSDVLYLM